MIHQVSSQQQQPVFGLQRSRSLRPVTLADQVAFTGASATNKRDGEECQGIFKSFVERVMSFLLSLVPPFVYRWIERKTLYSLANAKQHKVTLEQAKQDATLEPEEFEKVIKIRLARCIGSSLPTPDRYKKVLDQVEQVSFESSKGGKTNAWYIAPKEGKPTVLVSFGKGWPIDGIVDFSYLIDQGYGVMAYEYPGRGHSTGKPDEKRMYKSLEAASDFLANRKNTPVSSQIAYGISLGSAITTEVASRRKFKAVILQSSVYSLPNLIREHVGKKIPTWLLPLHRHLQSRFATVEKIKHVESPLLIMHGIGDPLVGEDRAEALFDAAKTDDDQKTLKLFDRADHNLTHETTSKTVEQFLEQLVS